MDDKNLETLLPDAEKPLADKYRKLILFAKNSRISKNDQGDWVKASQASLKETPGQFERLSGPALRASLETGKYRPPGLTGPPPPSVLYSRTDFRRNTVSDHKGIKRPAEEQPYGVPPVKRSRGLDGTEEEEEAEENSLSDDDLTRLSKLRVSLHQSADQLSKRSPRRALHLFEEQVPRLKEALEKANGAIEKARYEKERKARGRSDEKK